MELNHSVTAGSLVAIFPWMVIFSCSTDAQPALSRPPAVPLVTHDPYFSVWSMTDRLTDGWSKHWTGTNQSMTALVRIDRKPFRIMGPEPGKVPAMKQVFLEVFPTRTIYRFEGGLNLFPPSVAHQEIAFYKTKQNKYGLPLDNRSQYTKLDWVVWTATLADSQQGFGTFLNPVFLFAQESPSRVPLTDWYWTQAAKQRVFQARSVVGGVYIKMLGDPVILEEMVQPCICGQPLKHG